MHCKCGRKIGAHRQECRIVTVRLVKKKGEMFRSCLVFNKNNQYIQTAFTHRTIQPFSHSKNPKMKQSANCRVYIRLKHSATEHCSATKPPKYFPISRTIDCLSIPSPKPALSLRSCFKNNTLELTRCPPSQLRTSKN